MPDARRRVYRGAVAAPGERSVRKKNLPKRRAGGDKRLMKAAHERAYNFTYAIAGNFTNYEEATRALFANDRERFHQLTLGWPPDIRDHAIALGFTLPEG